MAGEGGARPLLPQMSQAQSFTYAPAPAPPRENQRNYVFVDEHNRHKRLKVMRACEGCRRRKIKCDAATTNSWPCAACTRLKLNCVPPTLGYDQDPSPGTHTFELQKFQEYSGSTISPVDSYHVPHTIPHHTTAVESVYHQPAATPYTDPLRMYQPATYMDPPSSQGALQYGSVAPLNISAQELKYQSTSVYTPPPIPHAAPEIEGVWRPDPNADNLANALGELKIDHEAVAPYISNQKKTLAEEPALEECEVQLPQHTCPGLTVRIPPEMMPLDQQALQYFDYFFTNIHPYVPVINRAHFYQQWHRNRDSISPLLLEAIFACSSLMIRDAEQGNRWLALASKHEESFKDVPRLSTIQAMLLVLKARESVPKRGYFYRSWMTVVNCVAMAKDLELDEHFEHHRDGKVCDHVYDCATRTRVWHTLFVLEIMIGGAQGRTDFGVRPETVDFSVPRTAPGLDEAELQVSREFTYFMRIAKNIRGTSRLHIRLRKQRKDWAIDAEFVQHNQDYTAWLRDLPQDFQVAYPNDTSPPWIPSHYVGNIHCYHWLGMLMHHRPQLHALANTYDGSWKQLMLLCHTAAKNMCRLQEAVLHNYGLPGLLCMQRGISFSIYCVLTSTMLHLAAITSPDPEINNDARDFFVRHMRILEQCIDVWPVPEMQAQVNALREAFSADTCKPFELKPSFPFSSPTTTGHSSPSNHGGAYHHRVPGHDPSIEQPGQVNYRTHPITPPRSASDPEPRTDSPAVQSLVMMAAGQGHSQAPTPIQPQEQGQPWNPSRIFDQWNVAFGTPPAYTTSQSSPPLRPPLSGNPLSGNFNVQPQQVVPQSTYAPHLNLSPHVNQVQNTPAQLPPPASYATMPQPSVTPSMWQDVVASSFQDGLKRRWGYGSTDMMDPGQMSKRAR